MSVSITECRDCLEAMREFPDGYFDLAVVDPPYGIGLWTMSFVKAGAVRDSRKCAVPKRDYTKTAKWDKRPGKEYFDELFRVSKKQIVWGGNYFSDLLYPSRSFIVWDKRCSDEMSNSFADCEIAWMSEGMGVARMFRYVWNGMIQGNMGDKEDRFHPTQKPVALYKWIFQHFAKPGDKILDTHLGSGSSRIAAYDAGLDFYGYEIDEEYFAAQEQRFYTHTAQFRIDFDNET